MVNPARPFLWTCQGFTVHEHMDVKMTRRTSRAAVTNTA